MKNIVYTCNICNRPKDFVPKLMGIELRVKNKVGEASSITITLIPTVENHIGHICSDCTGAIHDAVVGKQ